MEYRLLNAKNQEIRLITIISPYSVTEKIIHQPGRQESSPTDLVQCRLDHFSLEGPEDLQALKESSTSDMSHSHLNWFSCHESSACRDISQWSYSWGDYVALSYTWGDATDTRNIILNGHQTAIGANLESALRVLRDKQPIKLGYKMWVDALCINQRDIVERGQEVKRMRKIYRQARNVVIWLGNEGGESDKAMGLIRILSNACETGEDRAVGTALRKQPDLLGRGCWRALSKLLDRPYWDRLWVLQEIALGVGRTSILCGQKAVTWRELYNASFSFGTHNVDVMFSLIDQERRDAGLPAAGLKRNKLTHLDTEQLVQAGRAKGQFMCMLDLGRKSLAMDPRDKVYGLLGMLEASLSDHIVPDYNATVSQVFTDFAKAFIVASRSCLFPKAQSTLNPSATQARVGLTKFVKITVLNCLNNALGRLEVCHRGYLTGQTRITFVCTVVLQPIMLPKAPVLFFISRTTIRASHVKEQGWTVSMVSEKDISRISKATDARMSLSSQKDARMYMDQKRHSKKLCGTHWWGVGTLRAGRPPLTISAYWNVLQWKTWDLQRATREAEQPSIAS